MISFKQSAFKKLKTKMAKWKCWRALNNASILKM